MTLIVKEEVILVAVSHIKSVTVPCRESEESESESENKIQVELAHKDSQEEEDNKKGG